ncbi:MAG: GTP-binding protein [Anaeroplasmataceae bacterium]|nr:GTP-binding protein [Anaeroplasmataceae bacterium]MDE5867754.1 GTP-binding protein [Anaeroplasmataceae bacterium]
MFTSVGIETAKKYDIDALKHLLNDMAQGTYGMIVRAKGVICGTDSKWYQFNLTVEEVEVIPSNATAIGKICVIGSKIDANAIKKLF